MVYVVYSNHLMSSGTQSPSLASFCNLPKLILCRGMCLGSGTAPPAENAVASGKFNTQTISPSSPKNMQLNACLKNIFRAFS